jgi:hypothetical protein
LPPELLKRIIHPFPAPYGRIKPPAKTDGFETPSFFIIAGFRDMSYTGNEFNLQAAFN